MELMLPEAKNEIADLVGDWVDGVPTREQIEMLQAAMSKMPQPHMETEHYFVPGMYCRKVKRTAMTLIVGKVHLAPHFFMCTSGEIMVLSAPGRPIMRAGDVYECQPGTKRVTLALTDAIGVTVHKTDKTDLDEIEKELIEPDNAALFDARNQVKAMTIEGEKP